MILTPTAAIQNLKKQGETNLFIDGPLRILTYDACFVQMAIQVCTLDSNGIYLLNNEVTSPFQQCSGNNLEHKLRNLMAFECALTCIKEALSLFFCHVDAIFQNPKKIS